MFFPGCRCGCKLPYFKAVLMWGNCGERKEVALLARVALTTVGVCGCGLYSGVCVARLARGERVFGFAYLVFALLPRENK